MVRKSLSKDLSGVLVVLLVLSGVLVVHLRANFLRIGLSKVLIVLLSGLGILVTS